MRIVRGYNLNNEEIMTAQEIYDEFWASVPEDEKPEVLAMFYWGMTDAQKDEFLKETEG
jgi:hypothetical protein